MLQVQILSNPPFQRADNLTVECFTGSEDMQVRLLPCPPSLYKSKPNGAIVQVEHRNEVIKRSRNVYTSEKSHATNRDESTHRGDGRLKVKILLAPPKTSTANIKIQVKPPIASSNLAVTAIYGHVVKRLTQRSELNGV